MNKMSYDELNKTKNELIAAKQYEVAIKYLQKMLALATDVQEIALIMIELADVYFDVGNLVKAGILYEEFSRLYPGNSRVEYAAYKSVLCSFYSMLSSDEIRQKQKKRWRLLNNF